MDKKFIVSIYGSHNAAIAFYYDGKIDVYEVERYLNYKNSGLAQYKFVWPTDVYIDLIIKDYKQRNNITEVPDLLIWNRTDCLHDDVKRMFHEAIESKEKKMGAWHHRSHASGTFYQSPFNSALIVSFDGGGEDGFFNIYTATRAEGCVPVYDTKVDLGFAYMIMGQYMNDIKMEGSLSDGNLVYSGKLMGLTGYGTVRQEWIPAFKEFYYSKPDGINYQEKLKELSDKTGLAFNLSNRFKDKLAYDIAATHQQAFEDIFFEIFDPIAKQYPDLPICTTGGCALNVLLNTNIKKRYNRDMYVASNSNDCGQAIGMLFEYIKPEYQVDVSRNGVPILDYGSIGEYLYDHSNASDISKVTIPAVVDLLRKGKIIGVMRGLSEHGPRALGHRSIICDPGIENMKDILNAKVKNREWYRPFAPVCPADTANTYFNVIENSPYMSFAFDVREEWKSKLVSVTHIDGTARVQTLKQEEDEWLYDLLKAFGKESGYEVLLNTSFNVAGKPILTTVKDAFKVYDNTKLDCLIIEDNLIVKRF